MLSQEMRRLLQRLGLFGVLVACLVLFTYERPARAFSCCDTCNNNYISCMQGCGGNTACQETCGDKFDACENRCWIFQHQLC